MSPDRRVFKGQNRTHIMSYHDSYYDIMGQEKVKIPTISWVNPKMFNAARGKVNYHILGDLSRPESF